MPTSSAAIVLLVLIAGASATLELKVVPELSGIPQSSTRAVVSLSAACNDTDLQQWKAQSLDLVAVVDRSGSMSNGKLRAVKQALHFTIGQLSDHDRLSIVEYDHQVSTLMQPAYMTEIGKRLASSKVRDIQHRGGTNLCEGMLRGAEVLSNLEESQGSSSKRVAALLMMTDGLANQGVTATNDILATISQARRTTDSSFPIHTFGFGDDHDGALLGSLAESTTGMYYHVKENDQIPTTFADVLGGFVTTEAKRLTLTVHAEEGVGLAWWSAGDGDDGDDKDHSTKPSEALSHTLSQSLGELQAGESRHRLLQLSLPSLPSLRGPARRVKVATATLDFVNTTTGEPQRVSVDITLNRLPSEELGRVAVDGAVRVQQRRMIAAEALKRAADAPSVEQAKPILRSAIQKLQRGGDTNTTTTTTTTTHGQEHTHGYHKHEAQTKALLRDLHSALERMTDERSFRANGRQYSATMGSSHSRERAAAAMGLQEESGMSDADMDADATAEAVAQAAEVLGIQPVTLGVSAALPPVRAYDSKDVRRAYRTLSLRNHPDKHANSNAEDTRKAQREFRRVAEAYETFFRPASAYHTLGQEAMRSNLRESGMVPVPGPEHRGD